MRDSGLATAEIEVTFVATLPFISRFISPILSLIFCTFCVTFRDITENLLPNFVARSSTRRAFAALPAAPAAKFGLIHCFFDLLEICFLSKFGQRFEKLPFYNCYIVVALDFLLRIFHVERRR